MNQAKLTFRNLNIYLAIIDVYDKASYSVLLALITFILEVVTDLSDFLNQNSYYWIFHVTRVILTMISFVRQEQPPK